MNALPLIMALTTVTPVKVPEQLPDSFLSVVQVPQTTQPLTQTNKSEIVGVSTYQIAQMAQIVGISPRKDVYHRGERLEITVKTEPNTRRRLRLDYYHEHHKRRYREVITTQPSDGNGIIKFTWTIPNDTHIDDIKLVVRDSVYDIALGRRPTSPTSPSGSPSNPQQSPVNYPVKIATGRQKVKDNSFMETELTISRLPDGTGRMNGKTVTWSSHDLKGFTGGVEGVLLDQNDNILFVSPLKQYGVNGKYVPGAHDSRTDYWEAIIPADIVNATRKAAILQRHEPKNRLPGLFKDIQGALSIIKDLIQILG